MIEFATLTGTKTTFDMPVVETALSGRLVTPASLQYDEARSLWNGMIDRRPGLIVEAESEQDVIAAVNFAREHALSVAVRAGGHNIAGKALIDGGLAIDVRAMKRIDVDPVHRRAKVGPGATLGDVDKATQAHGLLVPTGINSTTGIAGLTLGGGFGWTTRKFGLTVDNLRSARIVTAGGQLLTVDGNDHPDLFWAIRGGGGNFGVVTEFEFDLHPAGPEVLAGMLVYPFDDAADVLTAVQAEIGKAPDTLTAWAVLRRAPPLPFLPADWHGRHVVVIALCGLGEQAEAAAAPFRAIGKPIADVVGRMSFSDWQAAFDPLLTPGARNYWKSQDVATLTPPAIDVLVDAVRNLPTEECEVFVAHVGGQMTRLAADATPWPNREPHYVINMHTRWRDAADDERCRAWARHLHEALAPHSMGSVYVNFIPDGDDDQIANAYGPNQARLQKVKNRYDSENLFRANQNVVPDRAA